MFELVVCLSHVTACAKVGINASEFVCCLKNFRLLSQLSLCLLVELFTIGNPSAARYFDRAFLAPHYTQQTAFDQIKFFKTVRKQHSGKSLKTIIMKLDVYQQISLLNIGSLSLACLWDWAILFQANRSIFIFVFYLAQHQHTPSNIDANTQLILPSCTMLERMICRMHGMLAPGHFWSR